MRLNEIKPAAGAKHSSRGTIFISVQAYGSVKHHEDNKAKCDGN